MFFLALQGAKEGPNSSEIATHPHITKDLE